MISAPMVRSMGFLAWTELRGALTSARVIVLTAMFGFPTVLLAYALGGSSMGSGTATYPLWRLGADGALVAFAYGFVPITFPAIPMAVAYDSAKRDRRSGYPETVLSRPVPRWSVALGRLAGLVAASSALALIVSTASIAALAGAAGRNASPGLLAGFLGSALVLSALHLCAAMVLLAVLSPSQFAWLGFPIWAYHHAIRPLGLIISGQFLLIVPIQGPVRFVAAWSDVATFTGMYMGFMSPAVPSGTGAVTLPLISDLTASIAFTAVSLAGLPWIGLLTMLYIATVSRIPLGR